MRPLLKRILAVVASEERGRGVPLTTSPKSPDAIVTCRRSHVPIAGSITKYHANIEWSFHRSRYYDFDNGVPGVMSIDTGTGSTEGWVRIDGAGGRGGSACLDVHSHQGVTHAVFPLDGVVRGNVYRISCWAYPTSSLGHYIPSNPGIVVNDADGELIASITNDHDAPGNPRGNYEDTNGNVLCLRLTGRWYKLIIEFNVATGEIRHEVFHESYESEVFETTITRPEIVGKTPGEIRLCALSGPSTYSSNYFDELKVEVQSHSHSVLGLRAIDNLGLLALNSSHSGGVDSGAVGRMARGTHTHSPLVRGTMQSNLCAPGRVGVPSVRAFDDVEVISARRIHSPASGMLISADFVVSRHVASENLGVQFIDRSVGGPTTTWLWDFGDGATSEEQHPVHVYIRPGKYDVVLCAGNSVSESRVLRVIDVTSIPDSLGDVYGWQDSGPYAIEDQGQSRPPDDLVAMDISAGISHSAAIRPDGTVVTWGSPFVSEIHAVPDGLTAIAIGAGEGCTIAIRPDNSVEVWGSTYGDFPGLVGRDAIYDVPAGLVATAISVLYAHALAIAVDGSVVAWGWNENDQCDVPEGLTAIAVSAGMTHSAAIRPDGTVVCWGDAAYGACNPPPGLIAVAIAAGDGFTVALREDGSVVGWGRDTQGQVSSDIMSGLIATDIVAGHAHCVAIRPDQTIVAWGWDGHGQCSINEGVRATKVAASNYHTLALGVLEVQSRFAVVCEYDPELGYVAASFTDLSLGNPDEWHWDFGDGFESLEQHPEHVYRIPGDHVVTLTAIRGPYTSQFQLVVEGPPISTKNVNFLPSVSRGRAPLAVEFFNQSKSGAIGWHWDFGDGETSDEYEPIHIYDRRGHYRIVLTATYGDGSSSMVRWIDVAHGGVPRFTANQMGPTAPLGVQFTCESDGPIVSRVWHFGDGVTSVSENPFHTYAEEGYYVATLRIVCVECGVEYSVITSRVVYAHHGGQIVLWGYGVGWWGGTIENLLIPIITATDNAELVFPSTGETGLIQDYNQHTIVRRNVYRVNKVGGEQWCFTRGYAVEYRIGAFPEYPPIVYISATHGIADVDGVFGQSLKKRLPTDMCLGADGNVFPYREPEVDVRTFYGVPIPRPDAMVDIVDIAQAWTQIYGVRSDGQVVIWGPSSELVYANKPYSGPYAPPAEWQNDYNNALVAESTPSGLRAVKIAAGGNDPHYMVALTQDGDLVVWGIHGNDPSDYGIPPEALHDIVDFGLNVYAVLSGAALKSDGTLVTWGLRPVAESKWNGLTDVTKICASVDNLIALFDDGTFTSTGPYTPYSRDANYPVEVLPATEVAVSGDNFGAAIAGLIVHPTGINVSRPSGIAPHTVEFSESSYDATYYVAFTLRYVYSYDWTWEWDFGDGSTEIVHLPESPGYGTYGPQPEIDPKLLWGAVTHTYHEPGVYDVSLRLTSMYGTESIHVKMGAVTVYPRVPPIAEFSHEADPELERTIEFVDESQRGPSEWHWDFGDGNESIEQYPTHAYAADGVYVTTLTVANDMGVDATSDLVEAYSTHSVDMVPVRGLVYDAEVKLLTGRDIPLAGATVTAGSMATETDEDGAFELLVPATYYPDRKVPVTIRHPGYEIATKHIPIDDPDVAPIVFRVWPAVQYAPDGRI